MTFRFKSLLTAAAFSLSLWASVVYSGMILLPGQAETIHLATTE